MIRSQILVTLSAARSGLCVVHIRRVALEAGIARVSGSKLIDPDITEVDLRVSKIIINLWTNFAKTDNPGILGIVDWPA
jgi:hypothetical protein